MVPGTFSSLDVNNSIRSENNTFGILDDITDTKLPILWINKTYQVSFHTKNILSYIIICMEIYFCTKKNVCTISVSGL